MPLLLRSSIHRSLPPPPITATATNTHAPALVSTRYTYYHYLCDGFDDRGWGCAFRSAQTVISSILLLDEASTASLGDGSGDGEREDRRGGDDDGRDGGGDKDGSGGTEENRHGNDAPTCGSGGLNVSPSIRDMQQALVTMGDKPASGPFGRFVGSTDWIGTLEVALLVDHFCGVECRVVVMGAAETMESVAGTFREHFRAVGTPIMAGGDVGGAMTFLGVAGGSGVDGGDGGGRTVERGGTEGSGSGGSGADDGVRTDGGEETEGGEEGGSDGGRLEGNKETDPATGLQQGGNKETDPAAGLHFLILDPHYTGPSGAVNDVHWVPLSYFRTGLQRYFCLTTTNPSSVGRAARSSSLEGGLKGGAAAGKRARRGERGEEEEERETKEQAVAEEDVEEVVWEIETVGSGFG